MTIFSVFHSIGLFNLGMITCIKAENSEFKPVVICLKIVAACSWWKKLCKFVLAVQLAGAVEYVNFIFL